ncbi:HAD-IIB family hydrolase [Leifsonia sp. Root112D2]|uniref:HAD-IIB family hydrolase n=1 Tax=Leifsonia sp. Root112D2 TaxID=1736426 RepID=UPI0006FB2B3A|nr:HAD-IIB family hydrolase [Leifsonia sp. Root112D2]KQV07445.1 HAD family hydrolase [Leifsonia sp. Root112D2]
MDASPNRPPQLVAFDLDDTLAASKSPISAQMAALLSRLLARVEVCVISGGQFGQFRAQVIDKLDESSPEDLQRLHLMPACGTQYYRFAGGAWRCVYSEDLSESEKQSALAALERCARDLGYWESETWGPILEDRSSQITFSALGQSAPVERKMQWDPTGAKKLLLRERVAAELPDLEVRAGGSTSLDITRRGIDKAYGMRRLAELTQLGLSEMLFVGDRLDPGGNDYPVKQLGVPCIAVERWHDTVPLIEGLLGRL